MRKKHDDDLTTVGHEAPSMDKKKNFEDIWKELEIGPLNYEERGELRKIIADNIDVFARSPDGIGSFPDFKARLELIPNYECQWSKPFAVSLEKQRAISEWIERLYRADAICRAPPNGRWQSTCFVVPKKTPGQYRCVTDMRKPNSQFQPRYPPAKAIAQLLSEVQAAGSKIFSCFDVQHAFFSIHYEETDMEPTTFYADCGTNVSSWGENLSGRWKYKRVVMGAQPSSAALYEVMTRTLLGVLEYSYLCR